MDDRTNRAIRASIEMIPKSKPDYDSNVNMSTAINTVGAERSGEDGVRFDVLDDATRDKLIYFGRSDGAWALLNTIVLMRRVERMHTIVTTLVGLVALLVILVAYIAIRK